MITAESHWQPWGRFTDTLRTGWSGTQHAFGTDAFSWFQRAENKDQWDLFNAAMTSLSSVTGGTVAESYDFGGFRRIVPPSNLFADAQFGHTDRAHAVLTPTWELTEERRFRCFGRHTT